jgi:hypothetical protein
VQTANRRKLRSLVLALSVCAAAPLPGCAKQQQPPSPAPQQPETKPAPATPIDTKKVELGEKTWDPAWDDIVEKALPPELLSSQVPRDVRRFCPRFKQISEVDKRAFWAYFFQALAGAEAGLNPQTNVHHTEPEVNVRDGVSGKLVHSEGLLQLTYEDQKRYGCEFDWEADRNLKAHDPAKTILQPKNNLECGVKILMNQLIVQRKPLLSPNGYWSTLHPGSVSYRVFAQQMTNPPLACGLKKTPAPVKAQKMAASE